MKSFWYERSLNNRTDLIISTLNVNLYLIQRGQRTLRCIGHYCYHQCCRQSYELYHQMQYFQDHPLKMLEVYTFLWGGGGQLFISYYLYPQIRCQTSSKTLSGTVRSLLAALKHLYPLCYLLAIPYKSVMSSLYSVKAKLTSFLVIFTLEQQFTQRTKNE